MNKKLKAALYTALFMTILVILTILIYSFPKMGAMFLLICGGSVFIMSVYSIIHSQLKD